MEINLYAGKRVLYKEANGGTGWLVGEIALSPAIVNRKGIWLSIIPKQFIGVPQDDIEYYDLAEINQIFSDSVKIEEWMKPALLTREEYVKVIEDEEFERNREHSWVSDGEYAYYPISKYTANWIMKQPFEYVLRGT